MSWKLTVIIPTAVSKEVSNKVEDSLVGYFGGFSSHMITGGCWDGKRTVIEDSNLYFSVTGQPISIVREAAEWIEDTIKKGSSEEEVLIWIEAVML